MQKAVVKFHGAGLLGPALVCNLKSAVYKLLVTHTAILGLYQAKRNVATLDTQVVHGKAGVNLA